jgi:hypothetical protein
MYLIGLAFAAGAVILIFKRDFREAAAIFGDRRGEAITRVAFGPRCRRAGSPR